MSTCKQSAEQRKQSSSTLKHGGGVLRRSAVKAECECDECKKKKGVLQRKATQEHSPAQVPDIVYDVLRSPGQPLDYGMRRFMERRFNHDFSAVRIHTDDKAALSATAINARAYTFDRSIVFGANQYAPGSTDGAKLLAHELTHVAQHKLGANPISHLSIQESSKAEAEANKVMNSLTSGDDIAVAETASSLGIQRFFSDELSDNSQGEPEPDNGSCYEDTGLSPMEVGKLAHTYIQEHLKTDKEIQLWREGSKYNSRADIVKLWDENSKEFKRSGITKTSDKDWDKLFQDWSDDEHPSGDKEYLRSYLQAEIGEIKPYSYSRGNKFEKAKEQVAGYIKDWKHTYPWVPVKAIESVTHDEIGPYVFGREKKEINFSNYGYGVIIYDCGMSKKRKNKEKNPAIAFALSALAIALLLKFITENLALQDESERDRRVAAFVSKNSRDLASVVGLGAVALLLMLSIPATAGALALAALVIVALAKAPTPIPVSGTAPPQV